MAKPTTKSKKNSTKIVKKLQTKKIFDPNKGLNRSKKWKLNQVKIDKVLNGMESLTLEEAVKLLFTLEKPEFKTGPSVEIHAKLGIEPTKSDQQVRNNVVLPHGNGKKIKIAAFVNPENVELATKLGCYKVGSEDLIEEIKTTQKVDFDIAIAQPEMMKKLPVIARILGTAGVMPNPKNGTVGDNIEALIKEFMGGRVNFKNDKSGNVHFLVGRINSDFDETKITENLKAAIEAIEKSKPDSIKKKFLRSIHIATTMSPSISITL